MPLRQTLKPNSLKIIISILIFFLTLFLEIYCLPFEVFGRGNTGWHYRCGIISQGLKNLYYNSYISIFNFMGIILRLLFAYLISSMFITTLKKYSEKKPKNIKSSF